MPSALINHTLDSIIQGVSQQYQEGRHETQVERMVNCFPSVSRGVIRRNPIYKHTSLTTGSMYDPFTYVYDKGVGNEQYLIIIPGDTVGSWYVYNINDTDQKWSGTDPYLSLSPSHTARQSFKALTIGDLTLGHALTNQIHKVPVTIVYNKILFTNNLASGSGVNQAIQQGQDHLKNAWNSFSEAGTMLKDKFDDLALPKLGTLLKKKSSFLPGSMDSIRGGGGSSGSGNSSSGGMFGIANGISDDDY